MAEELTYTLAFTGQETDTNLGKVPIIEADLADHIADTDIHTTAAEKAAWDAKQDALPTTENDKYLHTNKTTGELEWSTAGAGVTETTLEDYMAHKEEYDASDNIIAIANADGVESLDIMYDNTASGLAATNMQEAIDELASEKQDVSTAITTSNIGSQSVAHATSADTATSATSATSATTATKATQDGNGNNIVNTYQPKSGAITTANIGNQSVAHATTADSATSATTATKATQDGSGNNIVNTYQPKNTAITTSNIGSQSVASATKATQDGSGNVITSTYETKANVTSKGSNTQPVYFDASGVAQPISQTIGNVAGLSYQVVSTWS